MPKACFINACRLLPVILAGLFGASTVFAEAPKPKASSEFQAEILALQPHILPRDDQVTKAEGGPEDVTPTFEIDTPTLTSTPSNTSTVTPTHTVTPTYTHTPICSPTPTYTITLTLTWTASPTATPNQEHTFSYGTLIIPMDTNSSRTNQNYTMWRAYGYVYKLLAQGIPVYWAIKSYKAYEANDFTVTQTRCLRTSAVYTSPAYNGGPFIIAAANSPAAVAILNAWNQGQSNYVEVHQYTDNTQTFNAPIFRKLRAAPSIAVYHNSDSRDTHSGAFGYLNAASIPDSNNNAWAGTSPDLLTEAQIAGTGNGWTGNHHDGALFLSNGLPKYCTLINMHWEAYPVGREGGGGNYYDNYLGQTVSMNYWNGYLNSHSNAASGPGESVAEIETYLTYPSAHVYAQCISVDAFENDIVSTTITPYALYSFIYGGHGHWLTTNGFVDTSASISSTIINQEVAYSPFAQATGSWTSASGAQTAFNLMPGSVFLGGSSSIIQYNNDASTKNLYPFMFMTGYYKGITAAGKVSYMCQHESVTTLPYTSNVHGPAMRYFYNSLFEAPNTSETVPDLYLTLTAPGEMETNMQITYTVAYLNLSGIAYDTVMTLPDPANTSYVSHTGGGSHAGGTITWTLGDLDIGASGTFTATYLLQDAAGWDAQAQAAYRTGPTHFTSYSNPLHTTKVIFTPTATISATFTRTRTVTPTITVSPTRTRTATRTATPQGTGTSTGTVTATVTVTPTFSATPICSPTPTYTCTGTPTTTPTITKTITATPVVTPEKVVAYPNPARLGSATGVMKFDNVPPGGEVKLFTLSGELVRSYTGEGRRVVWDGRNSQGAEVVPGIYLYVVTKPDNKQDRGKIFLLR